jgi:RNA recognition motif-containing protein
VFAAFGTVSDCTIVLDKASNKSKGFGFVVMPSKPEAIKALRQLNTRRIMDSVIRVKEATTT